MSTDHDTTRNWYEADEYRDAVAELFAAGDRDGFEGGVPACRVADHLGVARSTAKNRLTRLANEGDLVLVRGVNPETQSPRRSYAPPDAVDTHLPPPSKIQPAHAEGSD